MDVVITRDDRWTNFYNQGVSRKVEDPETFANIFWKTDRMFKNIKMNKISRGVKFISMDQCPKEKIDSRHGKMNVVKCQAITMVGKPCPFRATSGCGKFCKKHIIVE